MAKSPKEEELKKASYNLLLANRRRVGKYQYTIPSPQTYPYQWLWDSCFHAIILAYFSTDDSKRELLSLISKQFEDGLIPHMIYWEKSEAINIKWGKDGTSSITQPPMLAYAVWQIYKKDKDLNFLKEIYPNIFRFYNYLLTDRDPRGHHLSGIINPDESGEDNSPRFDIPLSLPPDQTLDESTKKRVALVEKHIACDFRIKDCMRNFFWVKDVPFNAILIENLKNMENIAGVLNLHKDVSFFNKAQNLMKKAMRDLMFEDGIFWPTYGRDYKRIKVKTWAIFAPLFAKIYSKSEAEKLINNHLLAPREFLMKYPVPTVSGDEPSYDPDGFWRGPIWMATNWFIFRGLLNYGFYEIAQKIKQASFDLIIKNGFREHFNPETGEGQGAENFTWGTLIVDMMEEVNN